MTTIEMRFPAHRFHATPWGRHVNEGWWNGRHRPTGYCGRSTMRGRESMRIWRRPTWRRC